MMKLIPVKAEYAKTATIPKLLSVLSGMAGVLLLLYMITVEDEPGAIPLLLIAIGAGGYLFTRYKIRSQSS